MPTILVLFAPSVPVRHAQNKSAHLTPGRTVCTLAPDHASAHTEARTKQAMPKYYRELPADLPKSERPPLPARHHSVPLFGFFIEHLLGTLTTPMQKKEDYGPIYDSSFFISDRSYIADYHAIVEILKDPDLFRSSGAFGTFGKLFGNDAMLQQDGIDHAKSRAALQPAFSPSLFPLYFKRGLSRARRTWDRVLEKKARGEKVQLESIFREHYLGITIEMTTGVDMDGEESARIRKLYTTLQNGFFTPPFGPLWNSAIRSRDEIRAILANVVKRNLAERADIIEKLREYGDDVVKMGFKDIAKGNVDVLLVSIAGSSLSTEKGAPIDEEVVDSLCRSMILLWFAGYATAAATSMCASFEMGLDDDVREKLIAEQDRIMASAPDGDDTLTYEQVMHQMPLLDSFLMEILRLHPAAAGINRRTARDVEILGRFVPKDKVLFCDFLTAMRDPNLYPEPNKIVLERFLKKEGESKTMPPPVLSFGVPGSPHYCIGALFAKVMMKTTFATLLREYHYTLEEGQSRKYKILPESTPESGIVVDRFEKRVVKA